jgi:uncharacterized 2Fe-2S/4Fe-4S cluster protein (DUF4445 family)
MTVGGHIVVELPGGASRQLAVPAGTRSLADVLALNGLPLNTRCGQRGLCRGCEVTLRAGKIDLNGAVVAAPAVIHACRAQLAGDVTIQIPPRSRLEHQPQVGETFEIAVPCAHEPLFPPVPGTRDTAFAVDVGTTTVVGLLVDLVTGEVLARAGGFNEQIRFGDNVVTRIDAARSPQAISALQRAVVAETIAPLLRRACERAGRSASRLAGGAIAGNTTMLHLLAGEDPSPLGVAPFTPRFIGSRRITAGQIALAVDGLEPATPLQLLPGVAAYVGADITAGIYATGMAFDATPALLVDMGTNGEIVLQNGGKLTACAAAAGPAFEGCGLRCGTRARAGAISSLRLAFNPFRIEATTIGHVPLAQATGLCGSAYLDFLAVARAGGLIRATGRFQSPAWENLPAENRLCQDGERAIRLIDTGGADALRISEADIARLLQAKAAIGAGIEILLAAAGLRASDLGCVYLAGGFGMHLNVRHAIAIGLLPGFRAEQVRVVGNTSLAGALLTLLDRTTLDEMEELRGRVAVRELNLAPAFEDCYIEHLTLP